MKHIAALLALPLLACATSAPADQELSAGDLRRSGTVDFPATCRPELKKDFDTAVALLHSFFYEEARGRFLKIAERDPGCAMAWWGVAMTWYHPLWAPPTPEEMKEGAAAIAKAKAIGGRNDLERGFIAAVDGFFNTDEKPMPGAPVEQSCHGPRVHGARAICFRDGLERLRAQFPDELEAQVFYALALLGTAPPTDKLYQNQLRAVEILEPLFRKTPTTRASRTTSSTRTTTRRWPGAAWRRRASTPTSLRGCRTPCTCRRTSTPGWGCGTSRSPRTSPRPRRRGTTPRSGTAGRRRWTSCTRSTTWSSATCRRSRTGRRASWWST